MARRDAETRARLAADGSLFEGYHPEMRAVHESNAAALDELIGQHGWPGEDLAGGDGAEAAWRIAQHAIGLPDFQRSCLTALEAAAAQGAVPAWQPAYLVDRILTLEGKPQVYGTQFDWDESGVMNPLAIEEPGGVDARRARVGLPPLAEVIAHHRAETRHEPRPTYVAKRRAQEDAWAREVGWR